MSSSLHNKSSGAAVAAAVALAMMSASATRAQQMPAPSPLPPSPPSEQAAKSPAAKSLRLAAAPAPQPQLLAAAEPQTQSLTLKEVIVTGTRQTGIEAAQSAAPIQVVTPGALAAASGGGNLMSALAQLVPSFTMQAFGFDMAGQTLLATLRGLSPNDVLILVNGKRRDTTANLAVDGGSVYQGGAGVDLNFIPLDAIDHVEVLTEGAAAQYGSDAIGGVINIILKKNNSGGEVDGTYGGDDDGGGDTSDGGLNVGFEPVPGGYVNITAEDHNHGHTNVGGPDPGAIEDIGSYPDSNMTQLGDYPYVNKIFGDAETHTKLITLNSGMPIANSDTTFYFFATYGDKTAASYENYREPGRIGYKDPTTGITTYPFPFGFNPLEATEELDTQFNGGFQGVLDDWNWDLGSGYGTDRVRLYTLDSIGNSYVDNGIPTVSNFYDGLLQTTQWTNTLDVNRNFDIGWSGPLNVAWGLAYRRDTYKIGAGIPESYIDGGAQSYPGFTPTDAGVHSRKNDAVYVDLAGRPVQPLRIDLAGRYEHYSDFGSDSVGKFTARWDFSPQFAIRGTVSSGFRAPTLAEAYYTSTNVGPTSAFVQLPPDSAAGRILGIGNGLKPEKSITYSLGFVWRPVPQIITTLDLYQVTITDRIVGSGAVYGQIYGAQQPGASVIDAAINATGAQLDPDVVATGTTGINVFVNGIDTRTDGVDLSFDMPEDYAFGHVDWSVSGTMTKTVLTNTPPTLPALPGIALFDATSISDVTTATPLFVVNLGADWTYEKASVNLTEKLYGSSYEWDNDGGDNATGNPEYYKTTIPFTPITNLDLGYQLNRHVKVDIGALNLFNRFPPHVNGNILAHQWAYDDSGYVSWYPIFSPFGIDGGYYYAKATVSF